MSTLPNITLDTCVTQHNTRQSSRHQGVLPAFNLANYRDLSRCAVYLDSPGLECAVCYLAPRASRGPRVLLTVPADKKGQRAQNTHRTRLLSWAIRAALFDHLVSYQYLALNATRLQHVVQWLVLQSGSTTRWIVRGLQWIEHCEICHESHGSPCCFGPQR